MKRTNNTIGLFSLRLFLLPGEETTLHINELRYLQLITECFDKDICFGIPYQGKTTLTEFGSIVRVRRIVKTYDNGELDILIECVQNFKLKHYEGKVEGKLYPGGSIIPLRSIEHTPNSLLTRSINKYLNILHGDEFFSSFEDGLTIPIIVKMLQLSDEEKLRFIKITEEKRQNDFLLRKTKFITILLEQEKLVEENFYLN